MKTELLKKLKVWQAEQPMSNGQLACFLKLSDCMISRLKSGKRQLGDKTVRLIWQKIPELRRECDDWFHGIDSMSLRDQKQLDDLISMR